MADNWDFGAWATKCNLKCMDGRTIKPNAFAAQDGTTVPIMWNHFHDDPELCVGKALLHNRPDGVYMYGAFNSTEKGTACRELVKHGDIVSVSINANQLRETANGEVLHGNIKEVSLVLAGANPGALIDKILCHSADGGYEEKNDEAVIYTGLPLDLDNLEHSSDESDKKEKQKMDDDKSTKKDENEMTIPEVYKNMTDAQKATVNAIVGQVLVDAGVLDDDEEKSEEDNEMKHNAFDDAGTAHEGHVLTHADGKDIIARAKQSQCGSLKAAVEEWTEEHGGEIKHAAPTYGSIPGAMMTGGDSGLFPDYQDVRPGAPELITRDQTWIGSVINGVHKSPISRIRTRQMDVRSKDLRAKGYKKGNKKTLPGNMTLLKRTTDPQTVYRTDAMNRDDIIDITDFDSTEYVYGVMQQNLYEDVALAIMVGDGRAEGDDNKIAEDHIRPIWTDDDLYTIHYDIDLEAAKKEIQGSNTAANFGENYIFTEAFITASLYAREQYKGSGGLALYCTPHTLNQMLLSKDMNGRRIYNGVNDLMTTLNVSKIITAEQFEGLERTTTVGNKKKKLLGLYVNLQDYHVGSTKRGQLTRFEQFDIDFNLMKYLIETRLSGALTRVYSAIAIEEDVTGATESV
mgnify:CR=1 FL=1